MVRNWNKSVPKSVPNPLSKTLTREQLRAIFKKFDTNGDGLLSKEELKKAFHHLGALIPSWRAARGLHHGDANGDGSISGEEMDGFLDYVIDLHYRSSDIRGEPLS